MGQNKHVVLEINKGHGQLDKTFNKAHNQSFYIICLAGISPFYITTNNYPTAVAGHVTKASSMTTRRCIGKTTISDGLHIVSCLPGWFLFSIKGLDRQRWHHTSGGYFLGVNGLRSHFFVLQSLEWKQRRALKFQSKAVQEIRCKATHHDYFWDFSARNWLHF